MDWYCQARRPLYAMILILEIKELRLREGKITHSRITQQADVDAKLPDVQKHRDVHLVWLFLFSSDQSGTLIL